LISIGAYPAGSNAAIDEAIRLREPLNRFLRQAVHEGLPFDRSWSALGEVLLDQAATTPPKKMVVTQPLPRNP
jgi:flagellar biosynthesis/type III secretory pathway ATPase